MNSNDEDRVPKVHPMSRDVGADDPFEVNAEMVVGDPDLMMECILQEFALMGMTAEELISLFHNPGYPVLCELRGFLGDEAVRNRVQALIGRWGVMRYREVHAEPDPGDAQSGKNNPWPHAPLPWPWRPGPRDFRPPPCNADTAF